MCSYKVIWHAIRLVYTQIRSGVVFLYNRLFCRRSLHMHTVAHVPSDEDEEGVPALWWGSGLLASAALTMVVLRVFFGVEWYESLLSIVLAFLLAFVALQASGETDVNPIGVIGQVSVIRSLVF
jgi:hypothetical protein